MSGFFPGCEGSSAANGRQLERATFCSRPTRRNREPRIARLRARMKRWLSVYRLDRYDNVSDVTYLKRLIGMRSLRQRVHLAATA